MFYIWVKLLKQALWQCSVLSNIFACQRTTYVCIDIKQYKATDEAYPITKLGINDIISVRH